ncbi:G5 domain-containing protein [Streptococcus ratti]|uniref:LPXTG cell wall anchor domain-containing protein n=1 Tax=Streptococcus ratti TaxID=1341 RepID=A0A7X9LCY5_STRRT|nr:G5 domain-containing protein [Streptococcus ratti]NMD48457.1 LPXTG cell wall anchor domain-containing protein [Streptococcus ratti]
MKKLKKVKKQWIAVSIGTAASAFIAGVAHAETPVTTAVDSSSSSVIADNKTTTDAAISNMTTTTETTVATIAVAAETPATTAVDSSSSSVIADNKTTTDAAISNMATTTEATVATTAVAAETTTTAITTEASQPLMIARAAATTTSNDPLTAEDINDEAALKANATPVISSENQSIKINNATTSDNRTVLSQPVVPNINYTVKYDATNQWYYVDSKDFGLNTADNSDDTKAIALALKTANDIVMTDGSGTQYKGVAVKLSGIVNVARDQGAIDHYEVLTYGDGIPVTPAGSIAGVSNLANITPAEYATMTVDADGLTAYVNNSGITQTGIVIPIYRQNGLFNQIKIDSSLSNVTALFGDGQGTTEIKTNLVQLGQPWDSNENDTDSRDHAVVLVEGIDGFVVKDLSINIKNLTEAFGDSHDGFYVKGMPYYGKVNAIQIDDSDNVTVESVETTGANKAGVYIGSSYNSVSNIKLDPNSYNGKQFGTAKLRSVNYLVSNGAEGYSFDSLNLGVNNKVIDVNSHNNRVAGVQFAYQTDFLVEESVLSENGHKLNGSTGYGVASSAGSYNSDIIFRNNTSTYNYRKGFDIHDGDKILIENNVSYGDRLLGISVYNRTYPMENVIIRNNVVTQDPENRLAVNDLALDDGFSAGSDYIQYEAIHLQTNEKFRDLSTPGSVGYFEIENNTIQGLDASGKTKNGQPYSSNAILVRMQEPYLDYVLNIDNNTITGELATSILKIFNRANDNLNRDNTQIQTDIMDNGLGYGSGAITIRNNNVDVTTVTGDADRSISPIDIKDSISNNLIKDTTLNSSGNPSNIYAYQDKFRGSLVIEDNTFKFDNTYVSGKSNTVTPVDVMTNAEAIIFNNNTFDFGNVTQTYTNNASMQKALITVSGNNGPTVQPKSNGLETNTNTQASNLPSLLNKTQPFVFLNNDITISGISYSPKAPDLPIKVLTSLATIRYIDNNTFTSLSPVTAAIPKEESDSNGNTLFTTTVEKVAPTETPNSRQFNLAVERFSTEAPALLSSTTETLYRDTVFINDPNLAAGETVVDVEGQDGTKTVDTYIASVDNSVYDAIGDFDVNNPYPGLVRLFFKLGNVTDALDNNRVPGLVRGDYIVTAGANAGNVLEAYKTYIYNLQKNGQAVLDPTGKPVTASTDVTYEFANMPVALKDDTPYLYVEETVLTDAVTRVVRVGTNTTTAAGIFDQVEIPFTTTYIDTDELLIGQTEVVTPGENGTRTLTYREIRDNNTGQALSRELISDVVTTEPTTQVIRRGTLAPTSIVERTVTSEVDYTTIYIASDEIEKDTRIVKTPGIKGVRTIVYRDTISNIDGSVISTEIISNMVTTEPINQVILVGTKPITTIKRVVTETVPFETVYVNDSSLLVGTQLIQTTGQNGVRTFVYEDVYDLDNNLISSTLVSDSMSIQVINQVVRVGTLQAVETTPNTSASTPTLAKAETYSYLPASYQAPLNVPVSPKAGNQETVLPQTGDDQNNMAIIGSIMLIAGGISLLAKKRRED